MTLGAKSRTMLIEGAGSLGVSLDGSQVEQFELYAALLQLWGGKINLTSRLTEEEIVIYHFLDSLAGLLVIGTAASGRLADLGAGAGFPGIPLRIAAPHLDLCLMESSHKKMSFCREVVRRTKLTAVSFVEERVEKAAATGRCRRAFDWVVTRAFRSAAETLRLAHPLLAGEGTLLLYKGAPDKEELASLEKEAGRLGLVVKSRAVNVPFLAAARRLIAIGPPGFRTGMHRKT